MGVIAIRDRRITCTVCTISSFLAAAADNGQDGQGTEREREKEREGKETRMRVCVRVCVYAVLQHGIGGVAERRCG
jgi:hypothetical protein